MSQSPPTSRLHAIFKIKSGLNFWITCAIFLIWAVLYLPYLRTSPHWYGDETLSLELGRNVFHGSTTYGPLKLTFWHSFAPYQPAYLWLVGLFSAITRGDILGGRFFNTLLVLAMAYSIFVLGRGLFGIIPAFFGALLCLSYEQAIIHFRMIYCHNMVALGFTIMTLFLLRPSSPRNDWRVGCGLAIGSLAHPLFAYGAIAAFLSRIKVPRSWFRMASPPTLMLLLTFGWIIFHYGSADWLIKDLHALATYYANDSAYNSNAGQGLLTNMAVFFSQDFFHMGAAILMLLCLVSRFYAAGICGLTISILLLQNRQNLVGFYYEAIILFPILVICWAAGISVCGMCMKKLLPWPHSKQTTYLVALAMPAIFLFFNLPPVLSGKLIPRNQPWTTQRLSDVEAAAKWLNANTNPDDLVIANSNIAWLLKAKTADLLTVTAWEGYPVIFLNDTFTHDRFSYPASIDSAKFLVIGDIDTIWTMNQPNVNHVIQALFSKGLTPVWTSQTYTIFARAESGPFPPPTSVKKSP